MLIMQPRIHHKTNSAQHLALEMAVIAIGILEIAEFLSKLLGIESPTLGIGCVIFVLPEGRQLRQLLGESDLQVMTGHAFVIGIRFDVQRRALFKVTGVDHHVGGA